MPDDVISQDPAAVNESKSHTPRYSYHPFCGNDAPTGICVSQVEIEAASSFQNSLELIEYFEQLGNVFSEIWFKSELSCCSIVSERPVRWRSHAEIDTFVWEFLEFFNCVSTNDSVYWKFVMYGLTLFPQSSASLDLNKIVLVFCYQIALVWLNRRLTFSVV